MRERRSSMGVCEYVLKISVLEELPGAVEKAIQNLEKLQKESLSVSGELEEKKEN